MEIGIGLCGKMRSGKDTVADYLVKTYGLTPFAFGDRLKEGFHDKYPHIPKDPKPVRGYQLFGQLERYVVEDDIWITKCLADINVANRLSSWFGNEIKPVITDMRQLNEFNRLKEEGFTTIRVEAPLEARIERIKAAGDQYDPANLNFETETELDKFPVDFVIHNEGTLEELYRTIDIVMNSIGVNKTVTI